MERRGPGKRAAWMLIALMLVFGGVPVYAEPAAGLTDGLDVESWQNAADESGAQLDVLSTLRQLARGEITVTAEEVLGLLKETVRGEAGGAYGTLLAVLGPMLIWAVNRRLLPDGRLGGTAEFVCCLTGAGVMMGIFAGQMELAQNTIRRLGRLTEQVFPVLTGLMSAAGRPGTAGAVQAMVALGGGALTAFLERAAGVICSGAAVLAAAGCLTERMELKGLFGLCRWAGGWLLGGIMSAFLAMTTMSGVIGSAQDGVTVRAARYAADNLLPVVGGDIADTVDAMAQSAGLVRSAAGVTGAVVMIAVCIRPVVRIGLVMLTFRLAAALSEPVADGPLRRCAERMAEASGLLLASVAAGAAMFVTLTGVCLAAG